MGDNRIRIAVFLLSFEELFNNLFDRRVICSVKIRFWLFLIFCYSRDDIRDSLYSEQRSARSTGPSRTWKKRKGRERGSKTREKKERVRVTLEPRYCGRADSSLVDWFSPHSSSYHDSTRENFLSRRMRRNDAENRSQCPFSPLQPFGFLFFFLFPPPPLGCFRTGQRFEARSFAEHWLVSSNTDYFSYDRVKVVARSRIDIKVFRNRSPSCSLGRLDRMERRERKGGRNKWHLDLSIHLNKSTVGNPLAVAHPPTLPPDSFIPLHSPFAESVSLLSSNSGHLFLGLFFKCLPMEIVIILLI